MRSKAMKTMTAPATMTAAPSSIAREKPCAAASAFVVSQVVGSEPLVPKRFLRNRTRVSANVATMFVTASFFALFFSLTLYMEGVLHYSALRTGLAWGPFGLMLLLGFGISAQLLPRVGVKAGLIAAYLISAAGLYLLSRIGPTGDYAGRVLPGMLLVAFGQAISFIGLLNAALHRLGPSDAGLGSAMQSTSQQLGGSLGLAVLVSIGLRDIGRQVAHGTTQALAVAHGFSLAIELGAAVMVAGAVIVFIAFERIEFIPPEKAALEAAESALGETAPGGDAVPAGAQAPAD